MTLIVLGSAMAVTALAGATAVTCLLSRKKRVPSQLSISDSIAPALEEAEELRISQGVKYPPDWTLPQCRSRYVAVKHPIPVPVEVRPHVPILMDEQLLSQRGTIVRGSISSSNPVQTSVTKSSRVSFQTNYAMVYAPVRPLSPTFVQTSDPAPVSVRVSDPKPFRSFASASGNEWRSYSGRTPFLTRVHTHSPDPFRELDSAHICVSASELPYVYTPDFMSSHDVDPYFILLPASQQRALTPESSLTCDPNPTVASIDSARASSRRCENKNTQAPDRNYDHDYYSEPERRFTRTYKPDTIHASVSSSPRPSVSHLVKQQPIREYNTSIDLQSGRNYDHIRNSDASVQVSTGSLSLNTSQATTSALSPSTIPLCAPTPNLSGASARERYQRFLPVPSRATTCAKSCVSTANCLRASSKPSSRLPAARDSRVSTQPHPRASSADLSRASTCAKACVSTADCLRTSSKPPSRLPAPHSSRVSTLPHSRVSSADLSRASTRSQSLVSTVNPSRISIRTSPRVSVQNNPRTAAHVLSKTSTPVPSRAIGAPTSSSATDSTRPSTRSSSRLASSKFFRTSPATPYRLSTSFLSRPSIRPTSPNSGLPIDLTEPDGASTPNFPRPSSVTFHASEESNANLPELHSSKLAQDTQESRFCPSSQPKPTQERSVTRLSPHSSSENTSESSSPPAEPLPHQISSVNEEVSEPPRSPALP